MLKRLSLGLLVAVTMFDCAGPPSQIEYVSVEPQHPQLTDIATLVFKLEDYRGIPMAGSNVNFKLTANVPGVTISPTSGISEKGTGEVRVQIMSSVTATVQVVADAGGGKVAISPGITFTGTHTPSGKGFTFQCGPFGGANTGGVHAIGAYDETRHLLAGTAVDCYVHIADRNGDAIQGVSTSFFSEAGTITASANTDAQGVAIATHTIAFPLPHPTDPGVFSYNPTPPQGVDPLDFTGKYLVPLWMEPNTWTKNPLATYLTGSPAYNPNQLNEPERPDPVLKDSSNVNPQNNPRDNLVTMIAYTNGEEGFTDSNGNGKFDDGEPFDDLTEPFVDSNDNGTFDGPSANCISFPQYENVCVPDTGEKFIDMNGNKKWDGQNGKWDAATTIWTMERITWTGIPYSGPYELHGEIDDYNSPIPVIHPAQIGFSSPPPPVRVHCNEAVVFSFPIADPWWNTIAQNDDGDGCKAQQGLGQKVVDAQGSFMGRFFDYPPIRDYSFVVADALPRMPAPMTDTPNCFEGNDLTYPPIPFYIVVNCRFTASPKAGYHTNIPAEVTGLISRNTH